MQVRTRFSIKQNRAVVFKPRGPIAVWASQPKLSRYVLQWLPRYWRKRPGFSLRLLWQFAVSRGLENCVEVDLSCLRAIA